MQTTFVRLYSINYLKLNVLRNTVKPQLSGHLGTLVNRPDNRESG